MEPAALSCSKPHSKMTSDTFPSFRLSRAANSSSSALRAWRTRSRAQTNRGQTPDLSNASHSRGTKLPKPHSRGDTDKEAAQRTRREVFAFSRAGKHREAMLHFSLKAGS